MQTEIWKKGSRSVRSSRSPEEVTLSPELIVHIEGKAGQVFQWIEMKAELNPDMTLGELARQVEAGR